MKLSAKLRATRASHAASTDDLETRNVTVEAHSFDEAIALVDEQTPAGWSRIWVQTG